LKQKSTILTMQLESDYLDFLQNVEATVLETFKENPTLKDADVIKAYDRLAKYYHRKKQHLPALESSLTGNAALVFEEAKSVCEWRRKKDAGEQVEEEDLEGLGNDVPIAVLVRCIEKLHKSAENWTKRDGPRGYLSLISNYIP
jgi:hypothetical protein